MVQEPPLSQEDRRTFDRFARATTADPTYPSGPLEGYWFARHHIDFYERAAYVETRSSWTLEARDGVLEGRGTEQSADDGSGAPRRDLTFTFEGELDAGGLFRGWKIYEAPSKPRAPARVRFVGRREETMLAGRFFDPRSETDGAFFLLPARDVRNFHSCLVWLVSTLVSCTTASAAPSLSMRAAHKELVARIGEGEPPLSYAKRWAGARNADDEEHWKKLLEVDGFLRGTATHAKWYPTFGRRMRWALLPVVRAYLQIPDDDRDERIRELEAQLAERGGAR